MREPNAQPVPEARPGEEERIEGMRVGWVVAVEPDGTVRVDYPGNRQGPLTARTTVSLDARSWSAPPASARRQSSSSMRGARSGPS